MRLQAHTPEAGSTFSDKLEQLDVSDYDLRLKIIADNGDTQSAVALFIGRRWRILLEDSIYEPSGEYFDEETESPPFNTTGKMWSVDPGTGLVGEKSIDFREGEIQGLVYALDAIRNGGRLKPDEYVDFLIRQYVELDAGAMRDEYEAASFKRLIPQVDHSVVKLLLWAGVARPIERKVTTGFEF